MEAFELDYTHSHLLSSGSFAPAAAVNRDKAGRMIVENTELR